LEDFEYTGGMSAWDKLVTNCLAGTDRMGVSEALRRSLEGVPISTEVPEHRFLLEASVWLWAASRSKVVQPDSRNLLKKQQSL